MFVSLVLAQLLAHPFPGVAAADSVLCPPSHHDSPPPELSFLPPEPLDEVSDHVKAAKTSASDAIAFPAQGAQWFQSWAGGGSAGYYAVYDTTNSTYLTCAYYDTSQGLEYFRVPDARIPPQIPRGALGASFKTAHGIDFASTLAQIEAVYGPAKLQMAPNGLRAVKYTKVGRRVGNLHYETSTTFYFKGEQLVGVYRISGW